MFRRRVVAAFAVLAFAVVGIGCTRPKNQVEIGGGAARGGGGATPSSASGATTGGGSSKVDQAISAGDFGTLKGVCGKGGKPGTSSSQGVTSNSITVGTFSDPGTAARPGLNQELFDAGTVFTKWCNDLGGINGRKLDLDKHDAALTNFQPEMVKACQRDFFLVGGGAVFDADGQKTRLQCLLPDFPGYVVSPEARESDLRVSVIPAGINTTNFALAPYVNDKFKSSTKHVGYLYGNIPATEFVYKQYKGALTQNFGWKTVYTSQYNAVGESSWQPYAQKIANANVKGLIYVGEPENLGLLIQALANVGYKLDWIAGTANMYDPKLIKTAGSALNKEPVYVFGVPTVPFEEVGKSPIMQEYQALFAKYLPKGKSKALLGVESFSAWLLFAQSVKACGDHVSRKCVYEQGQAVKDWTAGGLQAPVTPSKQKATKCGVLLKATPDGFQVIDYKVQANGFNCDDKNVMHVKGNLGHGTTLKSVGKSLKDLK